MVCVSGLVYWDMPYGLEVASWDQLLTNSHLEMFFKQLAIVNSAPGCPCSCLAHSLQRRRASADGHGEARLPTCASIVCLQTHSKPGRHKPIYLCSGSIAGWLQSESQCHQIEFSRPQLNPTSQPRFQSCSHLPLHGVFVKF